MADRSAAYSKVAMGFHWLIAVLIVINLILGWRLGFLKGMAQFDAFQLHKSVGITVLLLSGLRLGWRLVNPPPPDGPGLTPWERRAAHAVHALFYVLMIGIPLSGWLVVSTSPLNIPTLLYHLVPWPHIGWAHDLAAAPKAQVNAASATTHLILTWSAVVLIALHLAAVAKHQLLDGHPVLGRMLPFGPNRRGVALAE